MIKALQQLSLSLPMECKQEEVSKMSRDCVNMFGHFLVRKVEGQVEGEGGEVQEVLHVSGEKAFRQLLKCLKSALEAGGEAAEQDIQDIVQFRYLAAADIVAEVGEVVSQVQKTLPPAEKKAKTSAAESKGSAADSKGTARKSALAMFS